MPDTERRRLPLAEADAAARQFRTMFISVAEKWEFAGSLRRRAETVKDIEHVIEPRFAERTISDGLFGGTELDNLLWSALDEKVSAGFMERHIYSNGTIRWGPRYRGVLYRGIVHELFLAAPHNYGCILAIRTGPADFSKRLVTALKDGGMYRHEGGRVVHVASGETVAVPDEPMLFRLAGMEYVEPCLRK